MFLTFTIKGVTFQTKDITYLSAELNGEVVESELFPCNGELIESSIYLDADSYYIELEDVRAFEFTMKEWIAEDNSDEILYHLFEPT